MGIYKKIAPLVVLAFATPIVVALVVRPTHHAPKPLPVKKPAHKAAKPVPVIDRVYTAALQGVLDAARPKGEARDFVRGCVTGATLNRHFCTWVYRGKCFAGVIVETPGEGTVPETHGRALVPAARCTPAAVFHWLGSQGGA